MSRLIILGLIIVLLGLFVTAKAVDVGWTFPEGLSGTPAAPLAPTTGGDDAGADHLELLFAGLVMLTAAKALRRLTL